MKTKIITLFFILCSLFILTKSVYAGYNVSNYKVEDYQDAITECPETCAKDYKHWTGNFWITYDNFYVCECLRDWPYCPVLKFDTPISCVPKQP